MFLNTFGSSTRVKWGISRKYNDTALLRRRSLSHGNFILSLTSQNTLTKTSVWHFPITYEAVTDMFMLNTNNRNTFSPFSWPHTSINPRYISICICTNSVRIRVINTKLVHWMCLKIISTVCLSDFHIYYYMCTFFFYAQRCKKLELH